MFSFCLFFEGKLIPTFLILSWGYQPERLQAGIYLQFYTLLDSHSLLVSIICLYEFNNLRFSLLNIEETSHLILLDLAEGRTEIQVYFYLSE